MVAGRAFAPRIRRGRSGSTPYQADLVIENPASGPFRALRACARLRGTHLSCRATWVLLDGPPSWRQRGRPQPVNQMKYLGEQRSWDGDLRQLESDVATMTHDLGADLD